MILTGQEILDLARFAGFDISHPFLEVEYLEYEYTISDCPKDGVKADDGTVGHCRYVVTCDGCEPDECQPIGDVKTG